MSKLRSLTIKSPGANFKASLLAKLAGIEEVHVKNFPLESRTVDVTLSNLAKIDGLRRVTFERTGLTSEGMQAIAITSIVDLSLIGEELLVDAAYEPIGKMQKLEKLVLDATQIEAPWLEHLKNCAKLKSLALLKDGIATKRLPVIARFAHLEHLTLTDTNLKDLAVLGKTITLTDLELRRCGGTTPS